ncbi:MAG: hypothetical protein LBH92_09355 [Bacteroidales bacterium]|jgi:hypothetical protein|nr:hypothetical protein [Bacteroidales bacterium]
MDTGERFPALSSFSIFQELYDIYSREARMKRKYDCLVAQDNTCVNVSKKYDIGLVKKVTGFSDDKTAQEFMDFCNFKSDSLLQANQYDIYNMIYDCLSQFLKERE